MFRGQRMEVPAAGTNEKRCVYGATNYRTGQVHYLVNPRKNGEQFNLFLRQLVEAYKGRRVILVLDNASYHRTLSTLELLSEYADRVFIVWLPTYSPELNLIEGLWGYLKRSGLNNYFFGDVATMETAIDEVFADLNQHPETTLSLSYKSSRNLGETA